MGQNPSGICSLSDDEHEMPICATRGQENVRPTYEEVILWNKSFEALMSHKAGRKMFTDFLKGEFADENIMFWQACENLKSETDIEKIVEKVKIIFDDFISIMSPKEVSIDSRTRDKIHKTLVNPSKNIFDDAQKQVWMLMKRDSFPRFVQSSVYTGLLAEYQGEDLENND